MSTKRCHVVANGVPATLTAENLAATFDASNRHDVEGVMMCFANDCVSYTAGGPEVYGNKIEGAEAIAEAFTAVWTAMPRAPTASRSETVGSS